ncbi:MAG: hypothetical protein JST69_01510 [Bacteroidetes bacterium]|nr:hypothetical protein [Bacteroidota bacterium]
MKYPSILLVLFFLAMLSQAGICQEANRIPWMARENRIGIAIGIGSVTYADRQVSPLTYQSKPKVVKLLYQLETNHLLFAFDIDIKVGSTKSKRFAKRIIYFQEEKLTGEKEDKKFPVGGSFLSGKISVGAFYKIQSTQNSTFRVAAGGRISNELFYPQGWTTAGIFNALSFSPEGCVQHRIDNTHVLFASFKLPVLTQLTRLPYYNTVSQPDKNLWQGFFQNKQWVGLSSYLAPSVNVGYTYQINANWVTGVNYELNGYQITVPQKMYAVTHSFTANAFHQF